MYLLKVTLKAPKEKCVFNSEKKKNYYVLLGLVWGVLVGCLELCFKV